MTQTTHRRVCQTPRCNVCPSCDWNWNSDECYCKQADDELIILNKGQWSPKWCPRKDERKKANVRKQ